jgi:general secretion pathway protein G
MMKIAARAGGFGKLGGTVKTPTRRAMPMRRRRCVARAAIAGFTLLELLVVIAIIGLLAAYVGPKYFSQVGKSEQSVAKAQIDAFARAVSTYRIDVGSFPSTEEGLATLTTRPASTVKWNGPYLERAVPNDPWGRPYVYRSPGQSGDFEIHSLGKDGRPGGTGDDADISYR